MIRRPAREVNVGCDVKYSRLLLGDARRGVVRNAAR